MHFHIKNNYTLVFTLHSHDQSDVPAKTGFHLIQIPLCIGFTISYLYLKRKTPGKAVYLNHVDEK
jgi:hypothetical protein